MSTCQKYNYSPKNPSSPSPLAFLGKQDPLRQVCAFVKRSFSVDLEAWLSCCYRFHFKSIQLLLQSWNATIWGMLALGLTVILSLGWQFLSHHAFIRETPQAVHAESWASGGKHPVDPTSRCSRWWLGKDGDSKYCWLQMPWCLTLLYSRLQYWWPHTVNRSIAGCSHNLRICQSISVSILGDQHFIETQNSKLKTLINDRGQPRSKCEILSHTHTHFLWSTETMLHHLDLWHASQLTGCPCCWWAGERLWKRAWGDRTRKDSSTLGLDGVLGRNSSKWGWW